jgi:PncC family amidohydrolase
LRADKVNKLGISMDIIFEASAIESIRQHLISFKKTIAVAESVTAGFMQAALASAEQASDFFQGGITVYNINQKVRHLKIDREAADACNCVSTITADQMARGVIQLFQCDWSISVTGYATPVEESGFKLFAYYSICNGNEIVDGGRIDLEHQTPEQAQLEYVNTILNRFAKKLGA